MPHKRWETKVSAFVLEASDGLRRLALPIPPGDRVKTQIARAARKSGLSYWRAFDLWYGKARRVDASELHAIQTAQAMREQDRADEIASIAADFEALAERSAALAARSRRTEADAFRALARRARTLAEGK